MLWSEYWSGLGLPADFQNFEHERISLPGVYKAPRGRLLLSRAGEIDAGTAAMRPIDEKSCEAKRLYVRPANRGQGVGAALLARLVKEAAAEGYADMFADTLPSMQRALQLYKCFGFSEVGPYSAKPTPGAIFLRLSL